MNYDSATSTFLCIFNDDSENSCNVTYGLCQGRLTKTAPGQSSKENPKTILVKLQDLTDGAYCYLARVSSSSGNKTFILNIEGQLIRGNHRACYCICCIFCYILTSMYSCLVEI